MIRVNVSMHRRSPGYEIKASLSFGKAGPDDEKNFKTLQDQLEKTIPHSYKAKYNQKRDELTVAVKAEKANEAQSLLRRMDGLVHTAVTMSKVR